MPPRKHHNRLRSHPHHHAKPKQTQVTEQTRKSARVPKPSDYARRIASSEGSADSSTPPGRFGDPQRETAGSTTECDTDIGTSEFVFQEQHDDSVAVAIQGRRTLSKDAERDPKLLEEARARPDWPRILDNCYL